MAESETGKKASEERLEEKAEEAIQHPRNPREFIVAIYPRSYFEKIKAGLEHGLNINTAKELAESLIRREEFYKKII